MRPLASSAIWIVSVALVVPCQAGPNLGMKLACKRYGDAWNSGSRSALNGQVTSDFAAAFNRMPGDMFAAMPRGGGGRVLSSSKGNGSGTVTVATSQGVMTFVVVGRGFNWRVADIYKAGDDGRTVSLKSYLDAKLTAREFIYDLKNVGGTAHHDSLSRGFLAAFKELSADDVKRVRDFLPPMRSDAKPHLAMHGNRAVMTVRFPGVEGHARFDLVREGSWKVDDYSVHMPHASIASFRNSLDTIAAVGRFREFMLEPAKLHPAEFTSPGQLQASLVRVHELGFLPMRQVPSPMKKCTIDRSGENVLIELADRSVRMEVDRSGRGAVVAKVDVTMGQRWADLGHLIALNERARSSLALAGLVQPRATGAIAVVTTPAPAGASVLEAASAQEVEVAAAPKSAASKLDTNVRPAVAADSKSDVRRVSHQTYAQPQRVYYVKKRPGLFRRGR